MRMIFRNINWVAIARVSLKAKRVGEVMKAGEPRRRTV